MMGRLIRGAVIGLAVMCGPAWAAPVSLDLKGATIPEFAELVFKTILRRDFVLGQGVGTSDQKISLTVKQMDSSELLAFVSSVLEGYGFAVDGSGSVVRVVKAADRPPSAAIPGAPGPDLAAGPAAAPAVVEGPGEAVEVYLSKYRNVESLGEAAKLTGVKVMVPKGTGAVVLAGKAERIAVALELLRALDRSSGVVDVRAAVIEYADAEESAQAFSAVFTVLGGHVGVKVESGQHAGSGVTIRGANFSAVLTALAGDSRFRQMAEPRLRVVDGMPARILVGSDFPVRGTSTVDKAGNPVQSVEYKQAGIILDLVPQVLENSVLLTVHQQVSSVQVTTSSGIDSPSLNKREMATTVEMRPGELVLLAGMENSTEYDTTSGLSFLPRFLRGASRNKARTQVFLLLEVTRGADVSSGAPS